MEQIGARGLGGAAEAPPDIHFERQEIECDLAPVAVLTEEKQRPERKLAIPRQPRDLQRALRAQLRELVGAGDAEIRARLFNARHRIAQIVVVYEGDAD